MSWPEMHQAALGLRQGSRPARICRQGLGGGGERTMGDGVRAGASNINALVLKYGDTA
jgi:hypothetical protein